MEKFCQSCGMPLENEGMLGTNKDGTKNQDYCQYCYQDGVFQGPSAMEDMIELCLDLTKDSGLYQSRDEGRENMLNWFPTLKRWKKAE